MLIRTLSMLLALAITIAPCTFLGAVGAGAGTQSDLHATIADHTHKAPAKGSHCPRNPGELDHACATDCHSWNTTSIAAVQNVPTQQAWIGSDAFHTTITVSPLGSIGGHGPPSVYAAVDVLLTDQPIYVRTARYRI